MAISDLVDPTLSTLDRTSLSWARVAEDIHSTVESLRRQLASLDWRSPAATVAVASATAGLSAARHCSQACLDVATAMREHVARVDRASVAADGLLHLGAALGRFL